MGVRALSPNPKAGVDHPLPQGLDTEIHTMKLRQLLGRQKLGCSARRASVTGIREFHAATEPFAQI
jgi:hypothetical protein